MRIADPADRLVLVSSDGRVVVAVRTPSAGRSRPDPRRSLPPGDELVSHIEGTGELRQRRLRADPRHLD